MSLNRQELLASLRYNFDDSQNAKLDKIVEANQEHGTISDLGIFLINFEFVLSPGVKSIYAPILKKHTNEMGEISAEAWQEIIAVQVEQIDRQKTSESTIELSPQPKEEVPIEPAIRTFAEKQASLWFNINKKQLLENGILSEEHAGQISTILESPNIFGSKYQDFCDNIYQIIHALGKIKNEITNNDPNLSQSKRQEHITKMRDEQDFQLSKLQHAIKSTATLNTIDINTITNNSTNIGTQRSSDLEGFLFSYVNLLRPIMTEKINELEELIINIVDNKCLFIDNKLLEKLNNNILNFTYDEESKKSKAKQEIINICKEAKNLNSKLDGVANQLQNYIARVTKNPDSNFKYSFFIGYQTKTRANNCAFAQKLLSQILSDPETAKDVLTKENIENIKKGTGAKVINSDELKSIVEGISQQFPEEQKNPKKGPGFG